MDILDVTNDLLRRLNVTDRPFASLDELCDNASSTLVALYESLFLLRLPGIIRRPSDDADYAENAQTVIDALRAVLPERATIPDGVSGESIAAGDLAAITYLIALIRDIESVIARSAATETALKAAAVENEDDNTVSSDDEGNGAEMYPGAAREGRRVQAELPRTQSSASDNLGRTSRTTFPSTTQPLVAPHGGSMEPGSTKPLRAASASLPLPQTLQFSGGISPPLLTRSLVGQPSLAATAPAASGSDRGGGVSHATGADAYLAARAVTLPGRPHVVARVLAGEGGRPFGKTTAAASNSIPTPVVASHPTVSTTLSSVSVQPNMSPSDYESGLAVDREGVGRPATAPHSQAGSKPTRPGTATIPPPLPRSKPAVAATGVPVDSRREAHTRTILHPKQPQPSHAPLTASMTSPMATRAPPVPIHKPTLGATVPAPNVRLPPGPSDSIARPKPLRPTPPATRLVPAATARNAALSPPAGAHASGRAGQRPFSAGPLRSRRHGGRPQSASATVRRGVPTAVGHTATPAMIPLAATVARHHIAPPQPPLQPRASTVYPTQPTGVSGGPPSLSGISAGASSAGVAGLHTHTALPGIVMPVLTAEEKLRATSAAALLRRHRMLMERVTSANREELHHLSALHQSAVKSRLADYHRLEADAVRQATFSARAARHERKVLAIRTRRVCEEMARHTLSLRLGRSSKQAVAANALLRAYATQVRGGAADSLRAAAEEQAQQLVRVQGSLAAAAHSMAIAAEVVREETAKQIAQRQAAMRNQREALDRAIRDMRVNETALLQQIKDEQTHAEEAFLAQNVEPVHPTEARGAGAGAPDAERLAAAYMANQVETDTDPGRVNTMRRVDGVLDRFHADLAVRAAAATRVIKGAAMDAAKAVRDADVIASLASAGEHGGGMGHGGMHEGHHDAAVVYADEEPGYDDGMGIHTTNKHMQHSVAVGPR